MTDTSMQNTVMLPEILDLTAASPLASELLAQRGKNLTVDASRVQRVGAQCVQVLLSASATWRHDELSFEIAKSSTEFLDGIGLLGLSPTHFLQQESA
jgi:chemotaxis protein CheX